MKEGILSFERQQFSLKQGNVTGVVMFDILLWYEYTKLGVYRQLQ
jgi:hypothetical protein